MWLGETHEAGRDLPMDAVAVVNAFAEHFDDEVGHVIEQLRTNVGEVHQEHRVSLLADDSKRKLCRIS